MTDALDGTNISLLFDIFDQVLQLVAATVPNVDPGKGSEKKRERERERGDRASGREQVKRSGVRNRPVGRRADGGEGENVSWCKRKRKREKHAHRGKNTLNRNKKNIGERDMKVGTCGVMLIEEREKATRDFDNKTEYRRTRNYGME